MCVCDAELPEFFHSRMVRAKKYHRCTECSRYSIKPGDSYEYLTGKWDGEFDTFKTCRDCIEFRECVEGQAECFCWIYGAMRESALETAIEEDNLTLLLNIFIREDAIGRGDLIKGQVVRAIGG